MIFECVNQNKTKTTSTSLPSLPQLAHKTHNHSTKTMRGHLGGTNGQ